MEGQDRNMTEEEKNERRIAAMQYRKKPVIIEAVRWFKNGDHPEDGSGVLMDGVNLKVCHTKVRL